MTTEKLKEDRTAHERRKASAARVIRPRMDELAENARAANSPEDFERLEPGQQVALVDWIRSVLVPATTVFRRTSYGMKHDFDHEPDGFYVRNGAFKGAMVAAGFRPVDEGDLNWRFRVKPAKPLARWQQDQMKLYGRGWLVRDRWREKGYLVIEAAQHLRSLEHYRECRAEQRPQIIVLKGKYLAEINLDTEPAGYQLTQEAVAAVTAVFAGFDSEGRYSHIVNKQHAIIRRVPGHRADDVAAALVQIVNAHRAVAFDPAPA